MTGFCGGYGCIDGLEVTHFSDQDNVRVLTESRSQGTCEAVYVLPDLTLVYHGLLVGVQILDRVLDCDDVAVLGTVDVVYHRRKRGRLTGTCRAGYQHQTARCHGELAEGSRQGKVGKGRDIVSQKSDSHGVVASLAVYVDSVTESRGGHIREVGVQALGYLGLMLDRGYLVDDVYDDRLGAVRISGELSDGTVQTYHRRQTCCEVQVRAAEVARLVQNSVDIHYIGVHTFHVDYAPL